MVMVDVNNSGLAAQVSWLGLRVDGCLELFYIHQMNQVNSRNDKEFVTARSKPWAVSMST